MFAVSVWPSQNPADPLSQLTLCYWSLPSAGVTMVNSARVSSYLHLTCQFYLPLWIETKGPDDRSLWLFPSHKQNEAKAAVAPAVPNGCGSCTGLCCFITSTKYVAVHLPMSCEVLEIIKTKPFVSEINERSPFCNAASLIYFYCVRLGHLLIPQTPQPTQSGSPKCQWVLVKLCLLFRFMREQITLGQ